MARTDLGDKQVCPSCGAKFYDLRKRPATCPKCSTAFDPADEGVRVKRGRSRVAAHDAAYEDDEDLEDKKVKGGEDEDEDEAAPETAEVDTEAEAEPILSTDDDEEEGPPAGEEIPEGFSEEEEEVSDAADDDSVPMLEDEEEFNEDELGVPDAEEDDSGA
ncbi:MAG: TIGR02300 family protein [Proteobacteria bacterium]|nr:TIGR02300 family protein [Pseudomonadota bacterium]